jgi:hypothetical protein
VGLLDEWQMEEWQLEAWLPTGCQRTASSPWAARGRRRFYASARCRGRGVCYNPGVLRA